VLYLISTQDFHSWIQFYIDLITKRYRYK